MDASDVPGTSPGLQEALARARTPRGAAEAVVAHLVAQGFSLVSLYQLQAGKLRCQAQHGYRQVLDGIPPDAGVLGRVISSGRTSVVDDAQHDADFLAAAPDLRSEVCAPVRHGGDVVGALSVESRSTLPADTRERLEECAAAYGAYLDRVGGLPPESAAQLVARLAGELAALDDEADVLARVVDAAVQVSGVPTAAIATRRGPERVGVELAVGPLAAGLRKLQPAQLAALAGWVQVGGSLYTLETEDDAGPAEVHGYLENVGVTGLAVVPLQARGRQLGILLVVADGPWKVAPDVIASMEILGAQAAASLLVARTVARLQDRARRDALTGLGHGVTFQEDLAGSIRSLPDDRRLAVLLIDLDDFKAINDRHGHQEGDRALKRLSAVFAGALRSRDDLYRIGGDEFAALVTVAAEEEASDIANRLVEAVRELRTSTISVGVALARPGEDADAVVRRADEAMYAAKAQGRDRACVAGPPATEGDPAAVAPPSQT